VKTRERELARHLRRTEGASIKERRTWAAQSSISRWVRDIELTEEQREALRLALYNGHVKGRTMNALLRREARMLAQEEGRMLALSGDARFAAGCMLYWAEGSRNRNSIRFVNSDPEMVRFFVSFLKTYWNVRETDFRLTCNLFADHVERQVEIEEFWLGVAALSKSCLCKSTVNVYGGIQEIGGFTREAWLE
jgi:hypothetical protein